MQPIHVAIDGPAGAGKSTVARAVASALGFLYIDTGAMYRSVAWLALQYGVSPDDELALVRLAQAHRLEFTRNVDGMFTVKADGHDITRALREPAVSDVVSQISVHPHVRSLLTQWQRTLAAHHSVVMDGRDVGT
ncbi:MAG: (d)CMP kinase, partial [Alicyclobacillus sp.]|nr:(d)CMP kinase [Alicyclobacillus sp.]